MKRIVDPVARLRKLLLEPECRNPQCKHRADDPHHIVTKGGKLGDDVEDNIMPLCRTCHDLFHEQGWLRVPLTWEEVSYAWLKLGVEAKDYLYRRYRFEEEEVCGTG